MCISGRLKMPEMHFTLKAESFCLTNQPWLRLCMSLLAGKSMKAEHRVCHHQDMEEIEMVEEEVEIDETMEDLDGPPSRMRRVEDDRYDNGSQRESRLDNENGVGSSKSVTDMAKRIDKSWEGGIILKNSLFPTKLLLTEGDTDITEHLLKDETEKPYLKITQRLRLDEAKLEDVSKRINSSSSHAIFLALAASSNVVPLPEGMECQSRPLKNLVSYLKQKDAAGVISLSNKSADQSGVLYAFPPCNFSLDLLKRVSRDLTDEGSKDDHLVVVVVKGG